jgi:hypothetical protein
VLKTPCTQQVSNCVLCFLLWVQVRLDLPVNLPNRLLLEQHKRDFFYTFTLFIFA